MYILSSVKTDLFSPQKWISEIMASSIEAAGGGVAQSESATSGRSEPLGCIYLITCLETGGLYVGQTIHPCIEDRYDEHVYCALVRKTRTYLYNSIRKYGPDMFSIELLCAVPYHSLNRMEAYWAEQLQTYIWDYERNFNMVWCGEEKRRGIKHTEDAINKMKKNWEEKYGEYIERMKNPEWRYKVGCANRGKHLSPEEREKLSKACKDWWTPKRRREWGERVKGFMTPQRRSQISMVCSDWWTDERRTEKSQQMISSVTDSDRKRSSEASTSFWSIPENREMMSLRRKGIKRGQMSSDARKNMSLAAKGKPKTQALKDSLKKTAAKKFSELFYSHLKEWVADPHSKKQWRYDMIRKHRDGRLLDEYISVLEQTPGWTWPTQN